MKHFLTLYDINYADKAFTMIDSLAMNFKEEEFWMHVVPLDDRASDATYSYKKKGMIGITEYNFRSDDYVRLAFKNRTKGEVCWSLASYAMSALMHNDDFFELTYLDSDLYFFSSPKVIFDELGDGEVAIIPHRFPEHERKRLEPNGLYNVSWVTFRSTAKDLLDKWAWQCIQKCSTYDGCGDQKYLDEWPNTRYKVVPIQNIGVGVAPWNISQYNVNVGWVPAGEPKQPNIPHSYMKYCPYVDEKPVVFYHYHEHFRNNKVRTGYPLREEDIKLIYEPYEKELEEHAKSVQVFK